MTTTPPLPDYPTVPDLAAHPVIRDMYHTRFRTFSDRALADPLLDAAGDEWARTHLACAPGRVADALRYLAAHDEDRAKSMIAAIATRVTPAIETSAHAELRGLISQHHRISISTAADPATRRTHATVAALLNEADPRFWSGSPVLELPDAELRDLIVASINQKIATTTDRDIYGHLFGARMLLTDRVAPAIVITPVLGQAS